jgi:hypothetical protein
VCVLNLEIQYDCFRALNSETDTAACVFAKGSDVCAVMAALLHCEMLLSWLKGVGALGVTVRSKKMSSSVTAFRYVTPFSLVDMY